MKTKTTPNEIAKILDKILKTRGIDLDTHQVIQGKGFIISYAMAGSGPTNDETAIVYKKKYYILNGNWLKEYKPLAKKGYKACKKFYDSKKKEHQNFWSN